MGGSPQHSDGSRRQDEFFDLFSGNARRLYAYICMLLPHWADADDVFQETNKVLWEKFDQFTPGTDFYAWASTIARFQVLAFRQRRQRSRLEFSSEFVEAVSAHVDSHAAQLSDQHQALAECVRQLRERDRQLIALRYSPQATTKSVAAQTGRSVDAIYKALSRIENTLLECVRRRVELAGRRGADWDRASEPGGTA